MSDIVDHAIERLQQMPADRQELLARLVLHEIEEDDRWLQSTNSNSDRLQTFVHRIIEADDRGECELLDPDQL